MVRRTSLLRILPPAGSCLPVYLPQGTQAGIASSHYRIIALSLYRIIAL